MEAHLKHMKEITDRLAAIGAPISEEDQVVTLLGSLPQSYSTLVTALEARVDDKRLNFVQQALIHEKQKINRHSSRTSTLSSVNCGAASELVKLIRREQSKQVGSSVLIVVRKVTFVVTAQERKNKNDQDLCIEPNLQKKNTWTWIQPVQECLQCHLAQRSPFKRTNGLWTLEHQVI